MAISTTNVSAGSSKPSLARVEIKQTIEAVNVLNNSRTVNFLDYFSEAQKSDVLSGTGAIDVTTEMQACINYVQSLKDRPTILMPVGKYRTSSTLTITEDCVSIRGLGMPSIARGDDSSSITRGPTLRYYGTGTALLIGVSPGVSGDFIVEVHVLHGGSGRP